MKRLRANRGRVDDFLSAAKRFKGYGPEEERAATGATSEQNLNLAEMESTWLRFLKAADTPLPNVDMVWDTAATVYYRRALKCIGENSFCPKDVEAFSIRLGAYSGMESLRDLAGVFLSALINSGSGDDFRICTSHFDDEIDFLGMKNSKKTRIAGDAGRAAGYMMGDGVLTVEGNACGAAGYLMSGGSIVIEKDFRDRQRPFSIHSVLPRNMVSGSKPLGFRMRGGTIVVRGDAYDSLMGELMEGGRIIVQGNFLNENMHEIAMIGEIKRGEIIIEGEWNMPLNRELLPKGLTLIHRGRLIS